MADLATNNSGLGKGGVAGSNAGNAHYNPREFSWSATAVSFGALMSVLQAYTQMRQDQAQIANDMSIDISNAALATGKAQMQAADAQAQATEEQANMSYAQAAGAGIGAVASITALGVAARSGSQVKPMETIANSMN